MNDMTQAATLPAIGSIWFFKEAGPFPPSVSTIVRNARDGWVAYGSPDSEVGRCPVEDFLKRFISAGEVASAGEFCGWNRGIKFADGPAEILARFEREHAYLELGQPGTASHRWCYFDTETEDVEGPNGPPKLWIAGHGTEDIGRNITKRFDHFEDALAFMLAEAP